MHGRMTALGVAAAVVGFVSGAAAMGNYVDSTPDGGDVAPSRDASAPEVTGGVPVVDDAARAVGDEVTGKACEVARFGEQGGVPGVSELGTLGTVAVDAVGGATGGGECPSRLG